MKFTILLFLFITFSFSFSIFGQTSQTLGDELNSIIKKELPELESVQPFALPHYPRTIEPQIESRWKTKDNQIISIKITIVGDLDEKAKEQDFKQYLLRAITPPSRSLSEIGVKALLVSSSDTVEIRFYKENLRVDINFEFPTKEKNLYKTAPKTDEDKALKIVQVLDKTIDRKRTFTPCYNDFQKYSIPDGETAEEKLFAAVVRGEAGKVKEILRKPINFDLVLKPYKFNEYGENKIMHVAAKQGCLEIMKLLVEAKADVEVKNGHGESPLISAIREVNLDIIKFLLKSGADVNIKGKSIDIATKVLQPVSLTANVSPAFKPKSGDIIIDVFYDSSKFYRDDSPQTRIEIIKLLVKHGLNLQDNNNLLFKIPCEFKDWCLEITEFLLTQGVDPNKTNDNGQPILLKTINLAQRFPDQAIPTLKSLIRYGADVNAFYKNKSILENVIEEKSKLQKSDEIIQILKDAGAK